MLEVWKPVVGYESDYEVSSLGHVRSLNRVVVINGHPRKRKGVILSVRLGWGYYNVSLSKDNLSRTWKVHRLVALAFIPNPNNFPQVNHRDGVRANNCANNLEWVTASQNCIHRNCVLNKCNHQDNGNARLSNAQVIKIRQRHKTKRERKPRDTYQRLASIYGMSRCMIGAICRGEYWVGVESVQKHPAAPTSRDSVSVSDSA